MQAQVVTPVRFVPFTSVRKVSGGEVFIKTNANGYTSFFFNRLPIDRATAIRKIAA